MDVSTEQRTTPEPRSIGAPGTAVESGTPQPLEALAAATFGTLSRLRGKRVFHPDGVAFAATLRVGASEGDVDLLSGPAELPALVRFSRAAGLPDPLPDVLGLALRVADAHGAGRHQDFLLVSSIDRPLLHHLLVPGLGGFCGQSFSSILAYRVGGKLRLVGALPATPSASVARGSLDEVRTAARGGGLRFQLALASLLGRWQPVAELRIGDQLAPREAERIAFNPWNTGGGIRPVGPLMGTRLAAYRASQLGRGLTAREIP